MVEKLTTTQKIERTFHWHYEVCIAELLRRGEPVLEHIAQWQSSTHE